MIYYESTSATVSWDEELDCVVLRRKSVYSEGEEFRTNYEKTLELIKQKHAHKILSDATDSLVVTQEDQKWMMGEFIPRVGSLGVTVAVVLPRSTLGRMSFQAIGAAQVGTSFFADLEEAKVWLRAQP